MSSVQDSSNMFLSADSSHQSSLVSGMATLKRTKNRRSSALPNAKKMYEEVSSILVTLSKDVCMHTYKYYIVTMDVVSKLNYFI